MRRLPGFSEMKISRLLASGKLKAAGSSSSGSAVAYKTTDLDRLLEEDRAELVARAAKMSAEDRAKLIHELATTNARLSFREPTGRDVAAAGLYLGELCHDANVAQLAVSIVTLGAQLESVTMKLTGMAATLAAQRSDERTRYQLRAEKIDVANNVIRAATVAVAGVRATGKTVMLDKSGGRTLDEKLCARRLPIFTDEKTLETLMAAAAASDGKRVKCREDHVDAVGARAGFANNFKRVGDRVVADVTLFESYANRAIVLETAERAPQQIGLSMDFEPDFEILGDRALIRVRSLSAVDIVDAGAVTPNGLL